MPMAVLWSMTFSARLSPGPENCVSSRAASVRRSIPLRSLSPAACSVRPSSPRRATMTSLACFSWLSSSGPSLVLMTSMVRIWNSRPFFPDSWMMLLPRPTPLSSLRISPTETGVLNMTRIRVPSPKSTPSFSPLPKMMLRSPASTIRAVMARAIYLYFMNRIWGVLKSCMVDAQLFCGLTNGHVEDQPRDKNGREQVGHQADDQRRGVSLDGPGAELEQENGGDDGCQVGDEDG